MNIFMHVRGGLYVQMSVFWGVFAVNSRLNICGFQESYQSSAEGCCSLEKNIKKTHKDTCLGAHGDSCIRTLLDSDFKLYYLKPHQ